MPNESELEDKVHFRKIGTPQAAEKVVKHTYMKLNDTEKILQYNGRFRGIISTSLFTAFWKPMDYYLLKFY